MPALAIAELLIDSGFSRDQIHLVGTVNGVETKLVPPTGVSLTLLDVRGFSRKLSLVALKTNLQTLIMLSRAISNATALLQSLKPAVVISVGGYGSVAAARAARKLKIPVITVSYDRLPGRATKLQARHAAATAVAYLPTKLRNATLTGAPVRRLIRNLDLVATRDIARERLGLPKTGKVVAVIGGSLGSGFLNALTREFVEQHHDRQDLSIIHLTGERFFNADLPEYEDENSITYLRLPTTDSMQDIYAASDLVISRAGASTIAELATVGRASVLIPWKQSAENHQFFNAKWLGDSGGAIVLDEDAVSKLEICAVVIALIDNREKLHEMNQRAREAGTLHRDSGLVQLISSVASNKLDFTGTRIFPLDNQCKIHIVGVGGPGMSAIATVLAEMGHIVSGSDIYDTQVIERLRKVGVKINIGHNVDVIANCDAVTGSPAIPKSNIEYQSAINSDIQVLSRAEILSSICRQARSIGVAGTHGKTTTSSMLTAILIEAKLNPSYLIGGDVNDFGRGASWTGSDLFVVEADESDSTHLQLPLSGAILTNVDIDHLDNFQTFDAIRESFNEFMSKVNGPRVLCIDDPFCAEIAKQMGAISYSAEISDIKSKKSVTAEYVASEIGFNNGAATFTVWRNFSNQTERLGVVTIQLRGIHNVRNALGALVMAIQLGASFSQAVTALSKFGGVARRFDNHGTHHGITYVDDYAHLPNEISAVLAGARDKSDSWSRVVAVFQPNRFNRMSVISHLYADSFKDADLVVVTDIYASGTTKIDGVTGELVVDAIRTAHPKLQVVYQPQRSDLVEFLDSELKSGDLCISMGCGDIATLPFELISRKMS
ncbi:MAG: UDP-N-acetylmuramate--L-alanine ligase [Actinomycetota bacterium]